MARLGGPAGGSGAATVKVVEGPDFSAQEDDDARALYEILADHVSELTTGEQLAIGAALQRNDWQGVAEEIRDLFRSAAREFLDEGGA